MDQILKIGVDGRCLEGVRTGAGRYLLNVLKYAGKAPDVKFILYFKHEIPTDAYFCEESFELKRLVPLGVESNAVFSHILLPRALKRDRVNLLFAPAYIAPWFCPVPFVVTLHDISFEANAVWTPPAEQLLLRAVARKAAYNAKHIITISQFSKDEITRLYGIPNDRISVTPLAADGVVSEAISEAEEKDIITKFGITGNFIFTVGIFINRRMPLETLYGFAGVARRTPGLQLLAVGKDRTHPSLGIRDHIERINAALGRPAVLVAASATDRELDVLYRKAKLLVWLSAYEGFGLPPLEAMRVGTPVITSNTSSLPEVVGDAALRIGSPEGAKSATGGVELEAGPAIGAVSDAMRRLLTDEALRQWLIARGKARAMQFSWQKTAEETLAVLREAAT